jgi:hypothetical protein
VEQSVDEVDTIKPSSECLETEVDRAVEALADDSEPNQPEATTEEEGGKTENGARQRKKKNNFNLKKQLSKADTKLRDLFAPVSRRGSGASTGTGGGGGGASGAGGLVSPHLLPDSKPVSPQEEHPAFHFPEPANCNAALPPLPPLAASGDSPVDSAAPRTNPEIPLLFDSDGNPIRPPRRLKKSLSAAAATCQPKSVGNRDSGWKRTWYSSDSDSTAAATATAAMAALAPPAPMQVLDLRFDPSDECCHTGFLDSLVRKFSKNPNIRQNTPIHLLPAPVSYKTYQSDPTTLQDSHHLDIYLTLYITPTHTHTYTYIILIPGGLWLPAFNSGDGSNLIRFFFFFNKRPFLYSIKQLTRN